jgi:hypothetical protein
MFKLDICRPDHLFASAWGFAVVGYTLAFAVPSVEVLLWITLFAIFFWCGAICSYLVSSPARVVVQTRSPGLGAAVAVLSAVSIYYAVQVLSYILGSGIGILALAEIRQAALGGDPVIANGNTLITAVQMNFCLALLGYIHEKTALQVPDRDASQAAPKRDRRRARRFFVCAALSLLISLLDGSRAFFLMGAICVVISQLIIGVYQVRRAVLFFVVFVTVFSVTFPFVRPEVESAFDGFKYTMVYFAGGIGSLDYALAGSVRVYWQDFEAIMNKLGVLVPGLGGYDLTTLRMDMVDISSGLQTNVYTALGVYNEYLGVATAPFAVLMGALLTFIGRLARRSAGFLFIYAFCAAATVLSLFHEYYLSTAYLLFKVAAVVVVLRVLAGGGRAAGSVFRTALGACDEGGMEQGQGQLPS